MTQDMNETIPMHRLKPDPKVRPAPEIVAGSRDVHKPWRVSHAPGAHCSLASGLFVVPLADTPAAAGIRFHELLHLRFSPADTRKAITQAQVPGQCVLAVEDARVQLLARKTVQGADERLDALTEDIRRNPVTLDDDGFAITVLLAVCTLGTPTSTSIRARLKEDNRPEAQRALVIVNRTWSILNAVGLSSFDATVVAARYLAEALDLAMSQDENMGQGDSVVLDRALEHAKGFTQKDVVRARWGTMRVVTPPLPLRMPQTRSQREIRASCEGAVMRYPGRWCSDGSIFAHQVKRPGGTVLVDCSGSMEFTAADIAKVVDQAPAATIACYNGDKDNAEGELRIVARRGHRVEDKDLDPPYAGNVIDGPALTWLTKQPGPRVWVSDGKVHGVGEGFDMAMARDVLETCRRGKIVRVDNAERAARALAGRKAML